MTFPGLECFIAVCQELNYTRAAEKLFISQPGVSKHIKALETELGVPLFDKSNTKKLKITPAGKILYDSLMRCKSDLDSAYEQMKEVTLHETLTLNLIEGFSISNNLFESLSRFQEDIKPAELILQSVQGKDVISALNHDQLAFLSNNEMIGIDDNYTTALIQSGIHLYIIASADHPAFREGHDPSTDDFRNSEFYISKGFTDDFMSHANNVFFDTIGFTTKVVELRNHETIRHYLKSGKGFTVGSAVNEIYYHPQFRKLKTPMTLDLYLVWKKKPFVNEHISELVKILRGYKIDE